MTYSGHIQSIINVIYVTTPKTLIVMCITVSEWCNIYINVFSDFLYTDFCCTYICLQFYINMQKVYFYCNFMFSEHVHRNDIYLNKEVIL